MSHDTHHTPSSGAENDKLNRLIRAAVASQDAETSWPDTESILAYLHGEGNDEQRRDVQEAICESAEFRRFLVDTAHQIEELTTPALIREFDAIRPNSEKESIFERFRVRLADAVRIPVLVPALAAAAILVIGLALDPLGWFGSPTTKLYATLDRSYFTTVTPRDGGPEPEHLRVAESAYDAALNELRQCVALDFGSGEFHLGDNPAVQDRESSAQVMTLNLIDDSGTPVSTLSSDLPHDVVLSGQKVQAWILFVPSTQLWQAEAHKPSIDLRWSPDMGDRGCVTFTYPAESGFLATPGRTFAIQ